MSWTEWGVVTGDGLDDFKEIIYEKKQHAVLGGLQLVGLVVEVEVQAVVGAGADGAVVAVADGGGQATCGATLLGAQDAADAHDGTAHHHSDDGEHDEDLDQRRATRLYTASDHQPPFLPASSSQLCRSSSVPSLRSLPLEVRSISLP